MNLSKSLSLCMALLGLTSPGWADPLTNAPANPAPASTNLLAIFITAAPSTLVLSDRDFVSYDRTTHKFKITADSAKRLRRELDPENPTKMANGDTLYDLNFPDIPFVLLASGKPVYSGMFSSRLSSMHFDCPVIRVDGADSMFLPLDATNAADLCILKTRGAPDDARSEPLILAALKKLGL